MKSNMYKILLGKGLTRIRLFLMILALGLSMAGFGMAGNASAAIGGDCSGKDPGLRQNIQYLP